ncbi:MAG: response regulator [Anaerolineae bacterium]|nr:response regulator [Anaerolineae bacterium]
MSKILYVEDNFQNFRLVMRMLMLEKQKHELVQAATGTDGLRMAADLKPDLILMDINLPDIDGVECTRRIKEDPQLKNIPIVALTANAMVGDREHYLAAGCDGYLRKPLNRADLQKVLSDFLNGNGNGNGKAPVQRVATGQLRLASEA